MPLAADLKPLPREVSLRLSPTRPNRQERDQDQSFSRMYQGRPSMGPSKSDTAIFLSKDFSEATAGWGDDEDGGGALPLYDSKVGRPARHSLLPCARSALLLLRQLSPACCLLSLTVRRRACRNHGRALGAPERRESPHRPGTTSCRA